MEITGREVDNLRNYLDRGGFIVVDDFRGGRALSNFELQLKKVFPDRSFVLFDVTHPIFDSYYRFDRLDLDPAYGREQIALYALIDDDDRIQVSVNQNDDLGEYWEWTDRGDRPLKTSAESHQKGINSLIYAMTH